jgi:hypothetical protein
VSNIKYVCLSDMHFGQHIDVKNLPLHLVSWIERIMQKHLINGSLG